MNEQIARDRRMSKRSPMNLEVLVKGLLKSDVLEKKGILADCNDLSGRVDFGADLEAGFKPQAISIMHKGKLLQISIREYTLRPNGHQVSFLLTMTDPSFFRDLMSRAEFKGSSERRSVNRRLQKTNGVENNKRQRSRRLSDLYSAEFAELGEKLPPKAQVLFRQKSMAYDLESITQRREWLEGYTDQSLQALSSFSEPTENFQGNIENLIGVSHVPIGVAGPLRVKGDHAKGDFFVPLATTEGVLVNSYTLGMSLITRSGGATVRMLQDEMRISPVFIFENIRQAIVFGRWIEANFHRIKQIADSTSRHGKLLRVIPKILGRHVPVIFSYDTQDAMGLNMICKATERAAKFICSATHPKKYFLRSNFSSNKKISAYNFQNPYGKSLIAEAIIPKAALAIVRTTPQEMAEYSQTVMLTGTHAGMMGNNGHYANGLAAIFIACGQDVAHVANSHVGVSMCETTDNGDLYVSAQLPNLLVGTVGGGTGLGTSRACLEIMGCYGPGKAKKFAEIIAATLLAGEISICAAILNGSYINAHELYGRNRPR